VTSDKNGWKRMEKPLSHFHFYIFSKNGLELGKKMELKMDEDIRKYGNRQIQMESRTNMDEEPKN
jgi:hypothetical protein